MTTKQKDEKPRFVFRLYEKRKLIRFPPVHEGDMLECLSCGRDHPLKSAVGVRNRRHTTLFLIYKCRGEWLIGAIHGRLIAGRRPDLQVP